MKLLRYSAPTGPRLGVLKGETIIPLDGLSEHYPTMLSIVADGDKALSRIQPLVEAGEQAIPLSDVALLAPIERPGKFMAIGMNYKKHVEEAKRLGIQVPDNQFWFNKQTSCIAGPFDEIEPGVSEALDYEVELVAVIGRPAKGVSEADAKNHVFGYMVGNDVSARDWQRHSPTFTMGKSFDTHGPIGPWIVTSDEIADPHNLTIRCLVNDELRQEGNTGEMVHNLWQQIAYLSTAFTLEPGDLIATGTPSGVGVGMQPPQFLKSGDVVTCEVSGIGEIKNRVAG